MKYRDPITRQLKEIVAKPAGDTLPIGAVIEWVSDVIPNNWLLCDGRAISRTQYSSLFSVLGTTWGEGDGSTTFNLPDKRGLVGVFNYIIKAYQTLGGVLSEVIQEGGTPRSDNVYSSQAILRKIYPVGSIYTSVNNTNPNSLFGGQWELIKQYTGGELVAYGSAMNKASSSINIGANVDTLFSDNAFGEKKYDIVNYINGIITGDSGTLRVYPKGIVGMVEAVATVSGMSNNCSALWWHGNGNTLPTGVSLIAGADALLSGPSGGNYGGNSNTYVYKVEDTTATNANFYVNPVVGPYGGGFIPNQGGVKSSLIVKCFARAGITYVWKRIS